MSVAFGSGDVATTRKVAFLESVVTVSTGSTEMVGGINPSILCERVIDTAVCERFASLPTESLIEVDATEVVSNELAAIPIPARAESKIDTVYEKLRFVVPDPEM